VTIRIANLAKGSAYESRNYIGLDVHQATISAAVMDADGKLIMECLLETIAATILQFIQGLHGTVSVILEKGTWAAWLHDLVKPACQPASGAVREKRHG
jgi:hypothetical protein